MTTNLNTFTGEFSYTVDAKGRVNIPSKFRKVLSVDNEDTFVITRGMDPCVWVYPIVIWQNIENDLKKLSSLSAINRTFVRNSVRYATPLTYDGQGRIQLTTNLINYADLDKKTLIIGMVNKIEIWNPDRLKEIDKKNMKIDSTAYDDLAEKIII